MKDRQVVLEKLAADAGYIAYFSDEPLHASTAETWSAALGLLVYSFGPFSISFEKLYQPTPDRFAANAMLRSSSRAFPGDSPAAGVMRASAMRNERAESRRGSIWTRLASWIRGGADA